MIPPGNDGDYAADPGDDGRSRRATGPWRAGQ
jgi:hypothetical protein